MSSGRGEFLKHSLLKTTVICLIEFHWFKSLFSLVFCWCFVACGILVPWLGIDPTPPAVGVWGLNCWMARGNPPLIQNQTLPRNSYPVFLFFVSRILLSREYIIEIILFFKNFRNIWAYKIYFGFQFEKLYFYVCVNSVWYV